MTDSASVSQSLRTLGNSDLQLTPIGFGAWAIGGGNWEFGWGPQDDSESIAAIHRALDWASTGSIPRRSTAWDTRRKLWRRALESRQATSRMSLPSARCAGTTDRSIYRSLKAASLREELENSLRRLGVEDDRSLPDSLAQSRGRNRRGLGDAGSAAGAGKDPLDRRFEFHRRADEAGAEDCADHQPAAALLHAAAGDRRGDFSVCQANGIGVINLLADGLWTADRQDDGRARGGSAGGRLAPRSRRVQRATPEPQYAAGGACCARSVRRIRVEPGVVAVAWTLHIPRLRLPSWADAARSRLRSWRRRWNFG